jgi:hypothetical protein
MNYGLLFMFPENGELAQSECLFMNFHGRDE